MEVRASLVPALKAMPQITMFLPISSPPQRESMSRLISRRRKRLRSSTALKKAGEAWFISAISMRALRSFSRQGPPKPGPGWV